MDVFINGIGNISPQDTYNNEGFLDEINIFPDSRLVCTEPNYKEFINPIKLRRMSRILKMGVTAAKICLLDAGVEMPDAIITGTGLGVMEDTEKFLISLIRNDEKFLTPTSFIQSTHNTVSAHIAVMLKCNKYNLTFVHGFSSFESALLDAIMLLEEHPEHNILLGGVDEMTDRHFQITGSVGFWKQGVTSTDLLSDRQEGSIAGEGAGFFTISGTKSEDCYARISGMHNFYLPAHAGKPQPEILDFLKKHKLAPEDIDLLVLGLNGDPRYDGIYYDICESLFPSPTAVYFKHLCGEYYTAGAFALWLTARILKSQTVPEAILLLGTTPLNKPVQNVLIYNQHQQKNHSLYLVKSC